MSFLRSIRDDAAERLLRIGEFTALFAVRDAATLEQMLADADLMQPSAYAEVQGLHDLRLVVLAPTLVDGESPTSDTPRCLLLSFAFDGDARDVLEALVERASAELLPVLAHCTEFRGGGYLEQVEFIARHRVESGYFFRDLGPVNAGAGIHPEAGDATRAEIERAFELEERFERFYVQNPIGTDPARLRAAFSREFADSGFPFPLTEFEQPVVNEARWARRAGELMQRLQARAARSAEGVRRRGAHAKTNGIVPAIFLVEPELPAEFRVGLFSEPGAEFRAVVRVSNGSERVQADKSHDARGFALSVELGGRDLEAPDLLLEPEESAGPRQDFVLFSHPTFFASDVRRFATLVSIASCRDHVRKLLPGLAFVASRRGLRESAVLARALLRRVVHPLSAEFHSGTAYSLGPDHVVKYSLEPADPSRFVGLRVQRDPDYLRRVFDESLRKRPIDMHLYVHVFGREHQPNGGVSLSRAVEDATLDWRELGAKKVRVATVRVGASTAGTGETGAVELGANAEAWSFNPWNSLSLHRPLGSLNRARLMAYRASAVFRGALPASPSAPAVRRESGWSWVPPSLRDSVHAAE